MARFSSRTGKSSGLVPAGFDNLEDEIVHTDIHRPRRGSGNLRYRWRRPRFEAHVIAGLRTGDDLTAVFKPPVSLGDGGNTNVLLLAPPAHGRDAFTWTQGAVFDQLADAQRHLLVEKLLAVQLHGGMSGQVFNDIHKSIIT
jgi:hypothetical protein